VANRRGAVALMASRDFENWLPAKFVSCTLFCMITSLTSESSRAGFANVTARIGHNGGPPLDPGADWRAFCWKRAHKRVWNTPPREIALARLARAKTLGLTYRQYTAVLLDRGIYL
jgi:hypothetical protein